MTTLLDRVQRATVADDVAALLTRDVQKKFPEWSAHFCRRGVGQMAGFLAACGVASEPLAPSQVVDEFWHAFVLRTMQYNEFCDRVSGRFIHHVPQDDMPVPETQGQTPKVKRGNEMRIRTLEAIAAVGYEVDAEFWPELSAGGECTQCYQGCTDSPKK